MGAKEEVGRGPSGGRVKLLRRLMLVVCAASVLPGDVLSQVLSQEYQLKAMYLKKIPSFVEWPSSAASASKTAFRFCAVGDYPFGTRLADEVRGDSVSGQKIELQWIRNEQGLDGCRVIFFSRSAEKRYGKILEGLKGKSVLTIGESEGFLEAGGMMELSFKNDRLQLEVNLEAARSANLKVDARLLAMAKRVVTKHGTPGG